MKLSFEGTLREILDEMIQMEEALDMLADLNGMKALPVAPAAAVVKAAPVEKPVDKPVAKPVEKKARTEKQLANDEKMRVAALARVAARRDAKALNAADVDPVRKPAQTPFDPPPEPAQPSAKQPEIDPAELVKIRTRTIEELQAAYANGHQKEVFELLSRFGNGAKSFRELPPESFAPIRRAIDLGALE
jgi:hypothetical protein